MRESRLAPLLNTSCPVRKGNVYFSIDCPPYPPCRSIYSISLCLTLYGHSSFQICLFLIRQAAVTGEGSLDDPGGGRKKRREMTQFRMTVPRHSQLSRLFSETGKSSLFLILVIPFLVEILLIFGLTTYISYRNGQKAVEDLANQAQWPRSAPGSTGTCPALCRTSSVSPAPTRLWSNRGSSIRGTRLLSGTISGSSSTSTNRRAPWPWARKEGTSWPWRGDGNLPHPQGIRPDDRAIRELQAER